MNVQGFFFIFTHANGDAFYTGGVRLRIAFNSTFPPLRRIKRHACEPRIAMLEAI